MQFDFLGQRCCIEWFVIEWRARRQTHAKKLSRFLWCKFFGCETILAPLLWGQYRQCRRLYCKSPDFAVW